MDAQHLLIVEHKGKPAIVRDAVRSQAWIEENDKLVEASPGTRFALRKVDEFLPALVAVEKVKVRTSSLELMGTGSSINHKFEFAAEFSSSYPLRRVFVVLALQLSDSGKQIFLYEVGSLERGRRRELNLAVPTGGVALGEGKYQLHVFADGREVFHTKQPFEYREKLLDRMVAKRIKDRPDGVPEPLFGPPPDYPKKLAKAKTKGTATISLRILPRGGVADASVVEATDPAFGEAALEAVRLWRFIPKIENGRPVACVVKLPFNFAPPEEAGK